jgi:putative ABC transport system permease protein
MGILHELRLGFRTLIKNPGFTAVAVTALALAIGVNSTVFTFVNAVLLRGLPFEEPHRIMHLENNNLSEGQESIEVSYRDYLDWRDQSESFEDLGAADEGTMNVSDSKSAPERVRGAWVTANTFPMLGQEPLMGRNFVPGEDEPGAEPVAILGYGLWQNRYGGDPEILGKTIRVNEVA